MSTVSQAPAAGALLRTWRQRRRVSQLVLAGRAGVSTRHLSYVETGRSRPSSTMIRTLADELDIPLREQNRILLAGGFAPAHVETRLDEVPMAAVHEAIERVLSGHQPYPALVIDHRWDLVSANAPAFRLLDGIPAWLAEPPVNVVRVSLHPDGLAGSIVNLEEWRGVLLQRLRRELHATGDPQLADLLREVEAYPHPGGSETTQPSGVPGLVVPLQLSVGDAVLSLISTTTVFGTPRDVTLSELAIEAFFPADAATRRVLTAMASREDSGRV